ncbi:MAG: AmmeMemoRadiSam system radical SAM enzyme [Candidatus Thorarchaeota archaeon]
MDSINPKFLKKGLFQKKDHDSTRCLTCERGCEILLGETGYCQTRINLNGEIYSLVYGLIPSLSFNPIEKKPLYHFYPGSIAITVGTYGCNFNCFWCQNHHISHPSRKVSEIARGSNEFLSPQELIEIASKSNCQGTSISFNEPTLLFEYSLEVFKLAKEKGLYNTYVTNGYMTEPVLRELVKCGLDAVNIDIKGDARMVRKYCGANVEKVWRNARLFKNLGVHVEITTLLIEDYNTDIKIVREISERICKELGKDTPYHLSRFFPHYKSHDYGITDPTPKRLLYKAFEIAKEYLDYVYIGNLYQSKYENTYCPNCSKMVIERAGLGIKKQFLDSNGSCKFCGYSICKFYK